MVRAGGHGGGWPPGPRARRRAGRLRQGRASLSGASKVATYQAGIAFAAREPDAIRDAVWANAEWIDATRDYWAHRSEALEIYSNVRILITRGHVAREAKRLVFDDYLSRQGEETDGYGRPIWLLQEGARFADEDR